MSRVKDVPHLKVLDAPKGTNAGPSQMALFPTPSPRLAVFAPMAGVTGELFLRTLDVLRPRVLLDVRVLPRFDLSGLSRAAAFRVFEEQRLAYRDITGLLNVSSRRDARLSAAALATELSRLLPNLIEGPVLFLTETEDAARAYSRMIPSQLYDRFRDWEVTVGWLPSGPQPV